MHPISSLQSDARKRAHVSNDRFDANVRQWDSLLEHQVRLFSYAEFEWLARMAAWVRSKRVVDFGCGNGDYLACLRTRFPDKTYIGVDKSEALIETARARHRSGDVEFWSGAFDEQILSFAPEAAILRFVVQHIADRRAFFDMLRTKYPTLKSIFIIEPCLPASSVAPDIPALSQLIDAYERRSSAQGHDRASLSQGDILCQFLGDSWSIAEGRRIESFHRRPAWDQQSIAGVLSGWLVQLSDGQSPKNVAQARAEISNWINSDGIELRFVMTVWHLHGK